MDQSLIITEEMVSQTLFQITTERIITLRRRVFEVEEQIEGCKTPYWAAILKNRVMWLRSLLELNEEINGRLSKMECNKIH
jgi:hypothetical protein